MIKKITALTVALMLVLSVTGYGAGFTDVAEDGSEISAAINVLNELGVIAGMGDGSFSPQTHLTRAQFAKIAVCVMGKTKEAVVTTDAFSDVKSNNWYSGYVNVVAKDGIIAGYPDGSFGADDPVTYAQAITIVVRLLGYDATDVGHKWPQGYVDKARVMGLTDGMMFESGEVITRSEAALLIYRALFTDMKDTKTALITRMDKNVYEDTVVIATNAQNAALLVHQVQTDKGIFTFDRQTTAMEDFVGYEGTVVVNDKAEVIAFVPSEDITKTEYTVSAVYNEGNGESISVITEDNVTVTVSDKTTVYMSGNTYTADKLAEGINTGSRIALFSENGSLKYVLVDEYKYEGPKTVLSVSEVDRLFNIKNKDSLRVIRKGISAALEDIELYDVLYYSERTNTLYAYTDKATGIYEEAFPMKSNVTRVTVSGKEYNLSSIEAVNKLNESAAAFDIGDRVTLLLGENGGVVDAVSLTADATTYGVVTGFASEISQEEDSKGKTEHYVEIKLFNGENARYLVEDDSYSDKAGRFCEIDYESGYAVLSFPAEVFITGDIDKDRKRMGDYTFANDYYILEYIEGSSTAATVESVTLAEIDGAELLRDDVKYVKFNIKGEIEYLYLNNATGNGSIYGVIVSAPEKGSFTILSGNTKYTTPRNNSYSLGDGVAYDKSKGTLSHMTRVATGNAIAACVDNIVKMDQNSYILSDDVVIYSGEYSSELKSTSMEEALRLKGTVTFYSDRSIKEGGKIRVIKIISLK